MSRTKNEVCKARWTSLLEPWHCRCLRRPAQTWLFLLAKRVSLLKSLVRSASLIYWDSGYLDVINDRFNSKRGMSAMRVAAAVSVMLSKQSHVSVDATCLAASRKDVPLVFAGYRFIYLDYSVVLLHGRKLLFLKHQPQAAAQCSSEKSGAGASSELDRHHGCYSSSKRHRVTCSGILHTRAKWGRSTDWGSGGRVPATRVTLNWGLMSPWAPSDAHTQWAGAN